MAERVAVTGIAVVSAYGYGGEALLSGVLSGQPAFGPVSRFDVTARRVGVAATVSGSPSLAALLGGAVARACDGVEWAESALYLAVHGDRNGSLSRACVNACRAGCSVLPPAELPLGDVRQGGVRPGDVDGGTSAQGPDGRVRVYTSACVAGSQAVADGAAAIGLGLVDRVVVAGGYLVEPEQFALFDAGRALAVDAAVRPFSAGRQGILLGDGVAAIVLEAAGSREPLAYIDGWGRAGDAYHVCQPRPDGAGLARAIGAAMRRAGLRAGDIGYVNAHGSGSARSDAAEAKAILATAGDAVPVSSTKSLHGQALEASPLIELVATILALREGMLPPNAGYLGPDPDCGLNLILKAAGTNAKRALCLNAAFGGANTALIVSTP